MTQDNKTKYNLEERTVIFAGKVLKFCKTLPVNLISSPIISQLTRSSTGIGANYAEANGGSSKKDFRNKIHLCKKESKETMYWLQILKMYFEEKTDLIQPLSNEARELTLIFSSIANSLNNKN